MKHLSTVPSLILFFLMSAFSSAAQTPDSIPQDSVRVSGLKELIVEGRTQRVIKHGVEYTPGKKMKRASADAAGLLLNMQIPMLSVSPADSKVKTIGGKDVSMFINYIPASEDDLKGIQTRDVIKVEVLEYPQDPRFNGAMQVVNFIVQKYEWGGYTKLMANGITLSQDYGDARLYSKFVYKKLTFDLSAGGSMLHDDNLRKSGSYLFKDIYFNRDHYDQIEKESWSHDNLQLSNQQWAKLRLSYSSDKTYFYHLIGFGRAGEPRNRQIADVAFKPEILSPSRSVSNEDQQSIEPYISAYYQFRLPRKSMITFSWNLNYNSNRRNSVYRLGGTDPIVNDNKESVWIPSVTMSYSKQFSHNNTFRVDLMTFDNYFKTHYSGSYNHTQRLLGSENMLFLVYMQTFGKKLNLYSRIGFSYVLARVNGKLVQKQWNPRLGLQLQYQHSSKWSASIEGWWGNSHPEASTSNSALVQIDELMWKAGNPDIRNTIFASASASARYIPVNWFSMAADISYEGNLKKQAFEFSATPDINGLISKTVNSGNSHMYIASLNATFKLLKNKLILNASGKADKTVLTGLCGQTRSWLWGQAYASYYVRNFQIMMYVQSPVKTLNGWSECTFSKTDMRYGLQLSYATSNLNVQLNFHNWFRKNGSTRSYFSSDRYDWTIQQIMSAYSRRLSATITYTFGYGKKISRRNELQGGASSSSSAILK